MQPCNSMARGKQNYRRSKFEVLKKLELIHFFPMVVVSSTIFFHLFLDLQTSPPSVFLPFELHRCIPSYLKGPCKYQFLITYYLKECNSTQITPTYFTSYDGKGMQNYDHNCMHFLKVCGTKQKWCHTLEMRILFIITAFTVSKKTTTIDQRFIATF